MKILNFDTSLEKTYISLSIDKEVVFSKIIENQTGIYHSAFLIPTIVELLQKNNLQIKDLDYIATNLGPGSFTGIRACLVVARTLCQQYDIKALGVSSLEILSQINNTDKKSLIMLDARKEMAYVEIIDNNGIILQSPCARLVKDIVEDIKNGDYFVIADNKMSQMLNENNIAHVDYSLKAYDLGKFLNEFTQKFVENNKGYDYNWAKLKPLYIQPPPVSTPKAKV